MKKCEIAKTLWESKYGDVLKTNVSGAVIGAITDPDGDGKVSLNDILQGIGGAHIWKAHRNGTLSAGLSMKVVKGLDEVAHTMSKYPQSLTPDKIIGVFRSLKVDSQPSDFMKVSPEEVKKILELSLDTYVDPRLHLKLWHDYGMYVPADFSMARMLDFHKLPEVVEFLRQNNKKLLKMHTPSKVMTVEQTPLEQSLGGYTTGNEETKNAEIIINSNHNLKRKFGSFVHEYGHIHQPEELNGVSPEYINNIILKLPKQLQAYNPIGLYLSNVGETEAKYIVALNDAIQNSDNKFLHTHPMVSMLNETKGLLNFINSNNIAVKKYKSLDEVLALPKIVALDHNNYKPNEIVEALAYSRLLDNKHLPFIYQELDKPGSVVITKRNVEDFALNEEMRKLLIKLFKL